jgi:hypothetical protein
MSNKIVLCPNCDEPILIEELNCCIFRHAILKETGEQINPHSSKDICDFLYISEKIYGCGKPFKIEVLVDGSFKALACEYI